MAPEQFRNAKNADSRCDIYSLAATLYMAVTGELPFRSCSPLDASPMAYRPRTSVLWSSGRTHTPPIE